MSEFTPKAPEGGEPVEGLPLQQQRAAAFLDMQPSGLDRLSQTVNWSSQIGDVSGYVGQVPGADAPALGLYSHQSVLQSMAAGPSASGALQSMSIPQAMLNVAGSSPIDCALPVGQQPSSVSLHDDETEPLQSKKRGRPPLARDDAKRASSVQEKNRQAQARFRQRQKDKMEAYDAQVRELKADKARLADENKALMNRKAILEKVLALKEEQIQVLQEGAGIFHAAKSGEKAPMPVDGEETPQGSLNSEQVIRLWKDCVKALSGLLMKLDSEGENEEVIAQIEELMSNTASVCRKVAFENPNAAKVLLATPIHEGELAPIGPDHWIEVVRQLNLAVEQRDLLLSLAQKYRSEMGVCVRTRKEVMTALANAAPVLGSSAGQGRNSLAAVNAATRLHEELRREHQIHSEFLITVLDRILTKLQLAQASVTSYPYFPDVLRMACAVEELMSSERSGGAASNAASDVPQGSAGL